MAIKITYNANTIASISNGEKTTLACKGKLMADNVCVDATENGEQAKLQEITINANGEFTPDSIYDGFDKVIVDIPNPRLQDKTVTPSTEEQTILPDKDKGFYGLSSVVVAPTPLHSKSVTADGVVVPDTGFIGLSSVTVNVKNQLKIYQGEYLNL